MNIQVIKAKLKAKWTRYTFVLALVQFLILSVIEAYVAFNISKVSSTLTKTAQETKDIKVLQVYHILFIIAQAFQSLFVCDAVFSQNTISLLAVIIFNASSTVYSIIQQNQFMQLNFQDQSAPEKLAVAKTTYPIIIVLSGFFTLLSLFFCWKMHKELGWKIYKSLGADMALKSMYRWYHTFILILQVDIFFYLGFSIQFIVLVLADENSTESGILNSNGRIQIAIHAGIGIATAFALYFIGSISVKRENDKLFYAFFIGTIATLGYFLWKLSQIMDPSQANRFRSVQKSLTYFTFMCISLALGSLGVGGFVKSNFGNGLRTHLMGENSNSRKRWMVE